VSAAEITALASGLVAVIGAIASLLGVISHLSWHNKQSSAPAVPPPAGDDVVTKQ